jgi:hypothetical protein
MRLDFNHILHVIVLTIKNVKESDLNVSYGLQLSYGANQTVQYTILLESASKLIWGSLTQLN